MLRYALIYSFISPAQKYDALEFRKVPRYFLPEHFPARRKQHNGGSRSRGRARFSRQRFHGLKKRLRLHHHAFAAAKRAVVHYVMPVMREIAQIMDVRFDQPRLARPPHNSIIQRPAKKLRKYRHNVESHPAHFTANAAQARHRDVNARWSVSADRFIRTKWTVFALQSICR